MSKEIITKQLQNVKEEVTNGFKLENKKTFFKLL